MTAPPWTEQPKPPAAEDEAPEQDVALGPVLSKALFDEFDYAVGLRDGNMICFTLAEKHGDWLLLKGVESKSSLPFPCPRGVQVRLADIVWAADAPEGS